MKSEKDKMLNGEYYNPLDTELINARTKARLLLKKYNELKENETEKKKLILKQLIPGSAPDLVIQAPFYCDYGFNIRTGSGVYLNFNCVLLDVCGITIGSRTIFGPGVQIYNASHPADHLKRASGIEFGIPVNIGDDAWIGGNVTILPGVNIGSRSIIGAGSVVIKDIPPDVMAAGNPCRVIKKLNIEA